MPVKHLCTLHERRTACHAPWNIFCETFLRRRKIPLYAYFIYYIPPHFIYYTYTHLKRYIIIIYAHFLLLYNRLYYWLYYILATALYIRYNFIDIILSIYAGATVDGGRLAIVKTPQKKKKVKKLKKFCFTPLKRLQFNNMCAIMKEPWTAVGCLPCLL